MSNYYKKKTDTQRDKDEFNELTSNSEMNPAPISNSKVAKRGSVKVKDLIVFDRLTETQQKNALRVLKFPEKKSEEKKSKSKKKGGGHHWAYSIGAIRKSLIHNDIGFGIRKIRKLKNERQTFGAHRYTCIDDNIDVIEKYMKLLHPKNLLGDLKNVVDATPGKKLQPVFFEDLEVLLAPELIYKADLDGKKVVGGVCFLVSKKISYSNSQRKAVAFLLSEFLSERYKQSEDITVSLDHCFCMDLMANKVVSAPKGTDVPYQFLGRLKSDCIKVWSTVKRKK